MKKNPARNYDREKAVTLICKAIINVDLVVIKKMLCLTVGHPAAIRVITPGGHLYCARCGVRSDLGSLEGWVHEGGNIWSMGKLTPTDLLLTGLPKVEKVPA